ncbi:MAG: hypothetical protein L0H84_24285, partial [Pseudonocardia sp.]|nr:hypothetical protein [Pseudonocardia sp.]
TGRDLRRGHDPGGSGPQERVERSLLDDWVARNRPSGDGRVTTVHMPYPTGDDTAPVAAAVAGSVEGDDDLVLLPVRVVWQPRNPSRLPHLLETVVTGDPRHPRPRRPFVEAYLVVAMALAGDRTPPAEFDRRPFLASCAALGKRLLLQKVIERPEAPRAATVHAGTAAGGQPRSARAAGGPGARRSAFVAELRDLLRRIDVVEQTAARNFTELLAEADEVGPPRT